MKDRIASRIRTVRLTKGLSQQNMADELYPPEQTHLS